MSDEPNWIPGEPEPDIEALPGHCYVADMVLDRYRNAMEPLVNWASEDLVSLRAALETELRSRENE